MHGARLRKQDRDTFPIFRSCYEIKLEIYAGAHIEMVADGAAFLSSIIGRPVVFTFNGIEVMAKPHHKPAQIIKAYNDKLEQSKVERANGEA